MSLCIIAKNQAKSCFSLKIEWILPLCISAKLSKIMLFTKNRMTSCIYVLVEKSSKIMFVTKNRMTSCLYVLVQNHAKSCLLLKIE